MAGGGFHLEQPRYVCASCGARLDVRVRFRGSLVWAVEEDEPDFSGGDPELRGDAGEPRLLCSADVLHPTGFRLVEGRIEEAAPK